MVFMSDPHRSGDQPNIASSAEAIIASARQLRIYDGPDIDALPFIPQQRLLSILRTQLSNTEDTPNNYTIRCRVTPITGGHREAFESVTFQRDHDEMEPSMIAPEGYEYIGHGQHVVLEAVAQETGKHDYCAAISAFRALPEALISRIAGAHTEHRSSMLSYDILAAVLPIDACELVP